MTMTMTKSGMPPRTIRIPLAMTPLKLAVLASHGGSNMQAIMDNIAAGRLNAQIMLVVSNNSQSGALDRARRSLRLCVRQLPEYRPRERRW